MSSAIMNVQNVESYKEELRTFHKKRSNEYKKLRLTEMTDAYDFNNHLIKLANEGCSKFYIGRNTVARYIFINAKVIVDKLITRENVLDFLDRVRIDERGFEIKMACYLLLNDDFKDDLISMIEGNLKYRKLPPQATFTLGADRKFHERGEEVVLKLDENGNADLLTLKGEMVEGYLSNPRTLSRRRRMKSAR